MATQPTDEQLRAHHALVLRVARPRRLGPILGGAVLAPLAFGAAWICALLTMGDPMGNETQAEWDRFVAAKQLFAWLAMGLFALGVLSIVWSVFWAVRASRYRFQAPPTWPAPPPGWRPPLGWVPPASWPQAPEGWRFWR